MYNGTLKVPYMYMPKSDKIWPYIKIGPKFQAKIGAYPHLYVYHRTDKKLATGPELFQRIFQRYHRPMWPT